MREIMLAEFRRQDILAEAARCRLADQGVPVDSSAPLSKEVLWSAVQSVCAYAGRALGGYFFQAFKAGSKKSAQTTITLAH